MWPALTGRGSKRVSPVGEGRSCPRLQQGGPGKGTARLPGRSRSFPRSCLPPSADGPFPVGETGRKKQGPGRLVVGQHAVPSVYVGLDADPAHVVMANEFAAGRGLRNVEVLTADARGTGLPAGSFDVVHARTVLVTVPEPAMVAAEMPRLARPGGWVVSVEPDTEYTLCSPPTPSSTGYPRCSRPVAVEPTLGSAVASRNCSASAGGLDNPATVGAANIALHQHFRERRRDSNPRPSPGQSEARCWS